MGAQEAYRSSDTCTVAHTRLAPGTQQLPRRARPAVGRGYPEGDGPPPQEEGCDTHLLEHLNLHSVSYMSIKLNKKVIWLLLRKKMF